MSRDNVASSSPNHRPGMTAHDTWAESVVGDWPPQGKLASERFISA